MKPISVKRKIKLMQEAVLALEMLERSQGRCMICGAVAPLEKNHTRDRKRFILTCRSCHCPGGKHKYLDDVAIDI